MATIDTAQGKYRAVITDPVMIEKAKEELAGGGDAGVPIGQLAGGDGGVNKGHAWHVVDLGFADFTIERATARFATSTATPLAGSRPSGPSARGRARWSS